MKPARSKPSAEPPAPAQISIEVSFTAKRVYGSESDGAVPRREPVPALSNVSRVRRSRRAERRSAICCSVAQSPVYDDDSLAQAVVDGDRSCYRRREWCRKRLLGLRKI